MGESDYLYTFESMSELKAGDRAPDFVSRDENEKEISLKDFRGKKLVLYFYPKDNTPGCTAEACDLRDHYQRFIDEGFAILGVSPDSPASHQKFKQKYELPFPLIADTEKEILKAYGAWGEKKLYGRTYMGVLRKTFIIDEKGLVEKIISKVKTREHSEQIFED